MTIQEAYKEYSGIVFKLTSYHEYHFTFKGISNEGETIILTSGGTSDETYNTRVKVGVEYSIEDIEPCFIAVIKKDGSIINIY